jgi:hypothetical protein
MAKALGGEAEHEAERLADAEDPDRPELDQPVEITEYSLVFSVVALPPTYLPTLMIAGDPSFHVR